SGDYFGGSFEEVDCVLGVGLEKFGSGSFEFSGEVKNPVGVAVLKGGPNLRRVGEIGLGATEFEEAEIMLKAEAREESAARKAGGASDEHVDWSGHCADLAGRKRPGSLVKSWL